MFAKVGSLACIIRNCIADAALDGAEGPHTRRERERESHADEAGGERRADAIMFAFYFCRPSLSCQPCLSPRSIRHFA